jgi:hypothetical protein
VASKSMPLSLAGPLGTSSPTSCTYPQLLQTYLGILASSMADLWPRDLWLNRADRAHVAVLVVGSLGCCSWCGVS